MTHLPILVVSTRTRDHLPGPLPRCLPGGPAHYIPEALKRLNAPYRVLTHEVVDVEVVHTTHGETYVIPAIEPIPLPDTLTGSAVILSPIVREIDPLAVPPSEGLLVVDIQGFVREPGVRSDLARGPFHLAPLLARAHLVKAADEELHLLDAESRHALSRTTALITGGKRGARIESGEGVIGIDVDPVDTPNTIGAGDTFLAAMTWSLVCGASMGEAARSAARFTEEVLRTRATEDLTLL